MCVYEMSLMTRHLIRLLIVLFVLIVLHSFLSTSGLLALMVFSMSLSRKLEFYDRSRRHPIEDLLQVEGVVEHLNITIVVISYPISRQVVVEEVVRVVWIRHLPPPSLLPYLGVSS